MELNIIGIFNNYNGVRQGGVLSPHLFVFYLNDLSVNLTKREIKRH